MSHRREDRTILAVGGSDHDVNACVVKGKRVVAAIEEERVSRLKYGIGGNLLAGLSRRYVLEAASLELDQFDEIVVDAIMPRTAWLPLRKRAGFVDHHICHAASAFFTSGFESAAVLVVDNAGGLITSPEGETALQATTWYHAQGAKIEPLGQRLSENWKEGPQLSGSPYQRGDGDHSLGHFYKKVTGALGYRFPNGAGLKDFYFPEDGITMGLAAYAKPEFLEPILELFEFLPEGQFNIWLNDGRMDALLHDLLAAQEQNFERRAAVASSAQAALERALFHVIEHVLALTGEKRLCLAGGVAMNSSANGKILRGCGVSRLYIPPVPGDNGTALGAALWTAMQNDGGTAPAYSVYAGRTYDPAEIQAAVSAVNSDRYTARPVSEDELLTAVTQLLKSQQTIGWFHGGAESGRRALGHRSILAAPQSAATRDDINSRIKRRQWFRPFAPVITEEDAARFFEVEQPTPYMQIVVVVKPHQLPLLGAVTHIDGSARLQTVSESQNALLHRLLRRYEQAAGIPVLLNTSFNGPGEPIVETPAEAVEGFQRLNLDALAMAGWLITKK